MAEQTPKTTKDPDWENRVLCSDESCIGVIGPDGRCKECGKPFGASPASEAPRPAEAEPLDPLTDLPQPDESAAEVEDETDSGDPDWESRVLCSDESCIGVIGPDGRCKECGKPLGTG